jgi:hypothetical protein
VKESKISIVEYLYETELYYEVLNNLLQAEKQLYLVESELKKFEL